MKGTASELLGMKKTALELKRTALGIKKAALCLVVAAALLSASACAEIESLIGLGEVSRAGFENHSRDSSGLVSEEVSEELPDTAGELFETEAVAGGLAVTAYAGTDAKVKIPRQIGGEDVVQIRAGAFSDAEATEDREKLLITEIYVPQSVSEIGHGAFAKCRNLQVMELPFVGGAPDKHGYIGYVFGGSDTASGGGFLPESLEKLRVGGKAAADRAFFGCENLKTIVLTEAESVGKEAFANCTALKTLVLPDSVASIGEGAFSGCKSLSDLTLPFLGDGNEKLFVGAVFGADDYKQNLKCVPRSLRTLTLSCPDELPEGAFYECPDIVRLNLKCRLGKVGERAFCRCRRLKYLNIVCEDYRGISEVAPYAFAYCGALGTVALSEYVSELPEGAFYACSSLRSLLVGGEENVLPARHRSLGKAAFAYCENLLSLKLPQNLGTLSDKAFYGCAHLTEMTVPASVAGIGDRAFAGCTSLKSVVIEQEAGRGAASVGEGAFAYCESLKRLVLPECVRRIGDDAFAYSGIEELKAEGEDVKVGVGVFRGCGDFVVEVAPSSKTYENFAEAGLGSDNFK